VPSNKSCAKPAPSYFRRRVVAEKIRHLSEPALCLACPASTSRCKLET
jgi:hypothetical protein